jgi:hypothetical protein
MRREEAILSHYDMHQTNGQLCRRSRTRRSVDKMELRSTQVEQGG